jgi:signal transduction histidine kinase
MTIVLSMAAGVLGTAQAMFLSRHDFEIMLGVCVAAGFVALAMSMLFAQSVSADSRVLHTAMRALGEDMGKDEYQGDDSNMSHDQPIAKGRRRWGRRLHAPTGLATAELDALSRELALTGARLNESRERERALERSRRELVAWVSHGVATEPRLYHTRMRQSVDRLTGMVDDLFELSRIHAGALRLSLERVSLADLVDEAVVGADPLAQAHGVRLTAEAKSPLAVQGDIRELSRALTNLVANAIRHTPSDGAVRVETADHGSYVTLAITDACGGIADEDLERVFEVAWRGTPARTPEPLAGAGLGLAIVRGIVEAHAGEVNVRNVVGGCRFEVRLPVSVG